MMSNTQNQYQKIESQNSPDRNEIKAANSIELSNVNINKLSYGEVLEFELAALNDENDLTEHNSKALLVEIANLNEKLERINKDNNSKVKAITDKVVNPTTGLGWMFLLGVGIFLKENLAATAGFLGKFLFPAHFVVDGLRNIWESARLIADKTAPQRKTNLGVSLFAIAGLAAASVVVALAITNPFALPLIFVGLVGSGIYRTAYALTQINKEIKEIKLEKVSVRQEIEELDRAIDSTKAQKENFAEEKENSVKQIQPAISLPKLQARRVRLEAKSHRLNLQLETLELQRFDKKRALVLDTLGAVAVGLLVASAVLTFVFPPAAAVVGSVGLMLFGATAIANVLTSNSAKIRKGLNWIKNLFVAAPVVEDLPVKQVSRNTYVNIANHLQANKFRNVSDAQDKVMVNSVSENVTNLNDGSNKVTNEFRDALAANKGFTASKQKVLGTGFGMFDESANALKQPLLDVVYDNSLVM